MMKFLGFAVLGYLLVVTKAADESNVMLFSNQQEWITNVQSRLISLKKMFNEAKELDTDSDYDSELKTFLGVDLETIDELEEEQDLEKTEYSMKQMCWNYRDASWASIAFQSCGTQDKKINECCFPTSN